MGFREIRGNFPAAENQVIGGISRYFAAAVERTTIK